MQKYELSRQTLKMTIVLRLKLYNILLYTVRTAYENTYDIRENLHYCRKQNTWQLLTLISNTSHLNSYNLVVQNMKLWQKRIQ